MAYDEDLAEMIRMEIGSRADVTERKMFGGIGFMVGGNMAAGVSGAELMVRVGPDAHDDAVAQHGVRIFDGGARPMRGWVLVDPEVAGESLADWIAKGVSFADALPGK